jgi:hypothetical protein
VKVEVHISRVLPELDVGKPCLNLVPRQLHIVDSGFDDPLLVNLRNTLAKREDPRNT